MRTLKGENLKILIDWFERHTGLQNVSFINHMNEIEKIIKNKKAPYYWETFKSSCSFKEKTNLMTNFNTEYIYKCNCEDHKYFSVNNNICTFHNCPLCPSSI